MAIGGNARAPFLVALALSALGCGDALPEFAESRERVVNGEDDRRQWFEVASADDRALLSAGVAALLWTHHLDLGQPGLLRAVSLETAIGVCADEPFASEPSAAWCSATLIDTDLVLTAGHCLGHATDGVDELCRQLRVVFDYHYARPGELALDGVDDVYACRRVAHYEYAPNGVNSRDLAVIQLDRPVSAERRPIRVAEGRVAVGDALVAASHGAGLPLKVDAGAVVTEVPAGAEYFVASTDSFSGGSGAPVFNTALELVAHQVRGLPDWESDGTCQRRAHAEVAAEEHEWAARSIAALCESGWPSEHLCGRAARCGDEVCNDGENSADCAADCSAPTCGDGLCEGDEFTSCASDCATYRAVPPAWRDAPAHFPMPNEGGSDAGAMNVASDSGGGCRVGGSRPRSSRVPVFGWLLLLGAIGRRRLRS